MDRPRQRVAQKRLKKDCPRLGAVRLQARVLLRVQHRSV